MLHSFIIEYLNIYEVLSLYLKQISKCKITYHTSNNVGPAQSTYLLCEREVNISISKCTFFINLLLRENQTFVSLALETYLHL